MKLPKKGKNDVRTSNSCFCCGLDRIGLQQDEVNWKAYQKKYIACLRPFRNISEDMKYSSKNEYKED